MIISFVLREVISFLNGLDSMEIVIIACSATVIVKMEFLSHKAEQGLKNRYGLINPAVSEYAITRIMMQFVSVAAFGFLMKHLYYVLTPSVVIDKQFDEWKELFWDVFGILIFFVAYFSSCTPKPYKPNKARKLIESNKITLSTATLPSRQLFNSSSFSVG